MSKPWYPRVVPGGRAARKRGGRRFNEAGLTLLGRWVVRLLTALAGLERCEEV